MRSMTGYGQATGVVGSAQVRVEIKTVNGRFLDLKVRLPRELLALEAAVCRVLDEALHRGRVDAGFFLVIQSSDQFQINEPLVRNYLNAAESARSLGAQGELTVSSLLQLPGVLLPQEQDFSAPEVEQQLLSVVRAGLEQVVRAREAEGRALRQDLRARVDALERTTASIEPFSEEVTTHFRQKLETKLGRMLEREGVVDQSRLAQEVIYYSEKADISEEITRLRSHIRRFREVLDGADGSVGKNLDFLCQEMNREMNTIVSKSPTAEISDLGVEGKVQVEKIREQVQNVE